MSRILVTGGAGFIGSSLVEALVERGDDVTVLDNFDPYYDPAIKRQNLSKVLNRITLIEQDLLEADLVSILKDKHSIVHLAARAGVRPSLQNPCIYMRTNVEGTQRLLHAMTEAGVNNLVFASSSSVYGARKTGPFTETDMPVVCASPYAASKKAAEEIIQTWHYLHKLNVTILRFFTVYGPRQRPDMAIHKFVKAILEDNRITLFGDGSSSRDYTYITDIVAGVLAAIDIPQSYEVINLGNSSPIRLDELVKLISKTADREARTSFADNQPGDVPMTWAQIEKAKRLLGYSPSTSLEEGIKSFVEWKR